MSVFSAAASLKFFARMPTCVCVHVCVHVCVECQVLSV